MRTLRPTTEDEMVAVFLRAELPSERHRPKIEKALAGAGADLALVLEPDLADAVANALRRRVLAEVRGYPGIGVFGRFPADARWEWAALTRAELLAVRYVDYDYWIELSGGTRLPTDAARRIRAGVEPFGVPNVGFFELADELAAGESFVPLIVVEGPEGLVVLEGHARLTAHALAPEAAVPQKIEVLLGRSEHMADWALY